MAPDGEAPVLMFWGVWSTSSLPLLLGSLLPGVEAAQLAVSVQYADCISEEEEERVKK